MFKRPGAYQSESGNLQGNLSAEYYRVGREEGREEDMEEAGRIWENNQAQRS